MKLLLLTFLLAVTPLITSEEIPICCCFFNKDPFRGFQTTKNEILKIAKSGLDKAELGSLMMSMCINSKGFPSQENIERLKTKVYTLSKAQCEKECFYLTRQLNDNYIIAQEKNRNAEAKILRKKKAELEEKINSQIKLNIDSWSKGGACQVTIVSGNHNSGGPNLLDGLQIQKREEVNDEDSILSFDSVSLPSHHSNDNPDLEIALKAYDHHDGNNFNGIRIDYNKTDENFNTNEDIVRAINELELEIMYLEKKNTKPIDFILERFTIKDNILVMIIKIFEKSLDEVLNNMKIDMEETIYFQFKIVENSNKKKNNL